MRAESRSPLYAPLASVKPNTDQNCSLEKILKLSLAYFVAEREWQRNIALQYLQTSEPN
jgi:hypothetical protein